MSPQPPDILAMDLRLIDPANSDHQLREIPQVENVMRFGRCGLETLNALVIDLDAVPEDIAHILVLRVALKSNPEDG